MPETKVTAGALAGAVVTLFIWIIGAATTAEVPPEAAAAMTTIVSFIFGYLVCLNAKTTEPPESDDE